MAEIKPTLDDQAAPLLPPIPVTEKALWSHELEQRFYQTSSRIAIDFEHGGAKQTDVYSLRDFPKERENMPHLRALTGLLLHLVGDAPISPTKNMLELFRELLSAAQVKTILDAGTSSRGPLLWLARTGILGELGVTGYALDIRPREGGSTASYQEDGITYYSATDMIKAPELFSSIDIVFTCGVLSIGGFVDHQKFSGSENVAIESPHFLHSASEFSHTRISALIQTLSDQPKSALIATSFFGSLAIHREIVSNVAEILLWQDSDRARESTASRDFRFINGVEPPGLFRSSAEGRAWSTMYREKKRSDEMVAFGEALLSGTKLAVFGKL